MDDEENMVDARDAFGTNLDGKFVRAFSIPADEKGRPSKKLICDVKDEDLQKPVDIMLDFFNEFQSDCFLFMEAVGAIGGSCKECAISIVKEDWSAKTFDPVMSKSFIKGYDNSTSFERDVEFFENFLVTGRTLGDCVSVLPTADFGGQINQSEVMDRLKDLVALGRDAFDSIDRHDDGLVYLKVALDTTGDLRSMSLILSMREVSVNLLFDFAYGYDRTNATLNFKPKSLVKPARFD